MLLNPLPNETPEDLSDKENELPLVTKPLMPNP